MREETKSCIGLAVLFGVCLLGVVGFCGDRDFVTVPGGVEGIETHLVEQDGQYAVIFKDGQAELRAATFKRPGEIPDFLTQQGIKPKDYIGTFKLNHVVDNLVYDETAQVWDYSKIF